MSDIDSSVQTPADPSALLGKLFSNPDLMRNLSAVLNAPASENAATENAAAESTGQAENGGNDGISRVLSNPEMMAKLPDVMKMLAPMIQGAQPLSSASVPAFATPSQGGERDRRGCRNDLLVALKPFLSPARCRAVDTLIGLSRLGDALQKLT